MKKALLLFSFFVFSLFSVKLNAGPLVKIGYINIQKVFQLYSKNKPEVQGFYKKQDEFIKKKQAMEAALSAMQKDIQERGILYTDKVKAQKEKELNRKYLDYQNFLNENGAVLNDKNNALTKGILDEIEKVIDKIGEKGGYSVILAKSNVLYGSPEMDLTDVLLKKLGLKDTQNQQ